MAFIPIVHVLAGVFLVQLQRQPAASAPASAPADKPHALVMLEKNRAALKTGMVEWSRCEASRDPNRTIKYTSRFAGAETTLLNRGDDKGIVIPVIGGPARQPESYRVNAGFGSRDQQWNFRVGSIRADV